MTRPERATAETLASEELTEALMDEWRELRDGISYQPCAFAVVRFAHRVGLLNAEQLELWQRRLHTCPGHDDEGGRDWCAICGQLSKVEVLDDAEPKGPAKCAGCDGAGRLLNLLSEPPTICPVCDGSGKEGA